MEALSTPCFAPDLVPRLLGATIAFSFSCSRSRVHSLMVRSANHRSSIFVYCARRVTTISLLFLQWCGYSGSLLFQFGTFAPSVTAKSLFCRSCRGGGKSQHRPLGHQPRARSALGFSGSSTLPAPQNEGQHFIGLGSSAASVLISRRGLATGQDEAPIIFCLHNVKFLQLKLHCSKLQWHGISFS